ncbi:unnamed protein product [Microthlaspi erraticum]|uniref:F-box domain-containing protein n=1 Tax=Microthlaspi erraticum TaxID=1685480 RepID=A0A6D2KGD5_9BRAS|nr:unnamed protein product [Microthlaspi erraticum]
MSTGNMAEREQTCLIKSLPDEILVDIIARSPICYHTAISVVSRRFRSLVASPELYQVRRSLFDFNEPCLYFVLENIENSENRVYILRRKPDGGRRLVLIPSLPALPREASFVAVDSKIHVFGGFNHHGKTSSALSIDCRPRCHTVQPLPSMPVPVASSVAGIIDEKIYVFGDTNYNSQVMVVFNTETQTWEEQPRVIEPDFKLGHDLYGCVVMDKKMCMRHYRGSFVYEPKENKLKEEIDLTWRKWESGCGIDDECYYYDGDDNKLMAYDIKESDWREVIGVEKLLEEARRSLRYAYTVSYGERQGDDIWGKVEWCDVVFAGNFYVIESLAAMGLSDMSVDLEMASELIKAKKEQKTTSLFTSLPDNVSTRFRSLVASPAMYAARQLLGCNKKQYCLYVVLQDMYIETSNKRLYILRRKPNGDRRLVLVPSLPVLLDKGSFVAVGSMIHVFSGVYQRAWTCIGGVNRYVRASKALSIDCGYHTVQDLPSMPVPMASSVAGVIDGKIYVVGYTNDNKVMVSVFNTERQVWEPEMIEPDMELGHGLVECVVMDDKMHVRGCLGSFVYEPKENKWEKDENLSSNKYWKNACVVGDVLYYYDRVENMLKVYDPKLRNWGVVKGVEELLAEARLSTGRACAVSYGEKLILFFTKQVSRIKELWCAEITLGERQGDDIWGKIEWCNVGPTGLTAAVAVAGVCGCGSLRKREFAIKSCLYDWYSNS